jgi:hypothetical protein
MIVIKDITAINGILPAFNNNIIEFKSDSTIESVQARVIINSIPFIIYKIPSGWFRFNFKEISKILVNKNNFQDYLTTNIIDIDINTYTYEQEEGFFTGNVILEVTLINGTIETLNFNIKFLSNVYNLEDYKKYDLGNQNSAIPLLPNIKNTNNQYFVKYFEGYPFDITFYDTSGFDIQFINPYSYLTTFKRRGTLTRLFFGDGENDLINNSLFSLDNNITKIDIYQDDNSINKYIFLQRVYMCGNDAVYLKWYNAQGGYSYWLFNKFYQKNNSSSNIGDLQNDFENLKNTIAPKIQIGKNSFDTIFLDSDLLNENEFNLLIGIFTSPKVYLFTGLPLARAKHTDWIEVEVKNKNSNIRDWKNRSKNIAFEIELPEKNTQTI